ncbi:MAG: hypothetical protein KDC67_11310, partial [Ignavibacteriae bacterium]|nr:hypothetical protein [Ignavibacteriota bacterium]
YLYMVDSFGGVYPSDVEEIYNLVKSKTSVKIGFHGHNNLELGLINTLTAIDCGVDIVDSTITGMGRGAGNLKTELLLTSLYAKGELNFDYNVLSKVVDLFDVLKSDYQWGTNLPYMVSGANSLPQKNVMEWVGKRFYSFNSIIRALDNTSRGMEDNINLEYFSPKIKSKEVLIVGGGPSALQSSHAIKEFLKKKNEVVVIHVSSRNVKAYDEISNKQIHCLGGNEGYRLEKIFMNLKEDNRMAILPPYPRMMGTYIPKFFKDKSYQLNSISFVKACTESVTSLAIQTALDLGANEIYFVGYDGYKDNITQNQIELFNENEAIFSKLKEKNISFVSLTKSEYTELPASSIYSMI